jgi:hypothetical protein
VNGVHIAKPSRSLNDFPVPVIDTLQCIQRVTACYS